MEVDMTEFLEEALKTLPEPRTTKQIIERVREELMKVLPEGKEPDMDIVTGRYLGENSNNRYLLVKVPGTAWLRTRQNIKQQQHDKKNSSS